MQQDTIENVAEATRQILRNVCPDVDREGLRETPFRFARYFQEMMQGYSVKPADVLKSFADGAEGIDEMVVERAIPFYSLCEHHLVPFFGLVTIGYIPNGRIVGLSKMPRLVDVFAHRLQVQERLTKQIADCICEGLQPKGVGVVIEARHLCMEMRGVQKPEVVTTTSALRGLFKNAGEVRSEFLALAHK